MKQFANKMLNNVGIGLPSVKDCQSRWKIKLDNQENDGIKFRTGLAKKQLVTVMLRYRMIRKFSDSYISQLEMRLATLTDFFSIEK